MSDEDIIRRKLMFDGDGTGDDKRINFLQKVLATWVSNQKMSETENLTMLNKCLSLLSAIECSWTKSNLMQKCVSADLELYRRFHKRTEQNIGDIKKTINESKVILQEVQLEKHHKLNYNMIAEDIGAVPSCSETRMVVKQYSEKISDLGRENSKLKADWMRWRQLFKIIATSSNELWDMLEQYKDD